VAPPLLGEFAVPPDPWIGGMPVGGISGIGRSPRGSRYMMISDYQSPRVNARFMKVQYFNRPAGEGNTSRTEWALEETACSQTDRDRLGTAAPEDIRADPRLGDVVWSHEDPGAPMLTNLALPDGGVPQDLPAPQDQPGAGEHKSGASERQTGQQDEKADLSSLLPLEPTTSPRFQLIEKALVSGSTCTDAGHVATLTSVLGTPINAVRKTLLADLAELGVPDPDNFEAITWAPDLPSGARTPLLVSDDDFGKELRTRVLAPALPPKPL
jgi:hypothetical protein